METKIKLSVEEALNEIEQGESLKGKEVDFADRPIKAMDALQLGLEGIDVPEHLITYNDEDIAYDPEFDDHEWERTDIDPVALAETPLTVTLDLSLEVRVWLEEEKIATDELLTTLLEQFYEAQKLIQKTKG